MLCRSQQARCCSEQTSAQHRPGQLAGKTLLPSKGHCGIRTPRHLISKHKPFPIARLPDEISRQERQQPRAPQVTPQSEVPSSGNAPSKPQPTTGSARTCNPRMLLGLSQSGTRRSLIRPPHHGGFHSTGTSTLGRTSQPSMRGKGAEGPQTTPGWVGAPGRGASTAPL